MPERRYVPNSLFRNGPNPRLNACVGNNGGPYDFSDYGDGFFEGAQKIVDAVKRHDGIVDNLIYSAAFSYRHGIELYVKHLLMVLVKRNKSDADYEKTHRLQDNWKLLVTEIKKSELKLFDATVVGIVGDIIEEFCEIDPTGQVFRYPEDLKGNAHLTDLGVINVGVLSDGMMMLHESFKDWRGKLDDMGAR